MSAQRHAVSVLGCPLDQVRDNDGWAMGVFICPLQDTQQNLLQMCLADCHVCFAPAVTASLVRGCFLLLHYPLCWCNTVNFPAVGLIRDYLNLSQWVVLHLKCALVLTPSVYFIAALLCGISGLLLLEHPTPFLRLAVAPIEISLFTNNLQTARPSAGDVAPHVVSDLCGWKSYFRRDCLFSTVADDTRLVATLASLQRGSQNQELQEQTPE